jgi:Ca2+-binding EF-hand superfamily protein
VDTKLLRNVDVFHAMDASEDGKVSPPELRSGLAKVGIALVDEDFAALVAVLDSDQNGSVSLAELDRALSLAFRAEQDAARLENSLAHPAMVKVEHTEAIRILKLGADKRHLRTVDLFYEMDENRDAKISASELREALTKHCIELPDHDFERFVGLLDADGSGNVSLNELDHALQAAAAAAQFEESGAGVMPAPSGAEGWTPLAAATVAENDFETDNTLGSQSPIHSLARFQSPVPENRVFPVSMASPHGEEQLRGFDTGYSFSFDDFDASQTVGASGFEAPPSFSNFEDSRVEDENPFGAGEHDSGSVGIRGCANGEDASVAGGSKDGDTFQASEAATASVGICADALERSDACGAAANIAEKSNDVNANHALQKTLSYEDDFEDDPEMDESGVRGSSGTFES